MICKVDVQGLLNTDYYVLSTAVLPICRIRNLMRIYPAFLITAYPCFSRAHDGVSPKLRSEYENPTAYSVRRVDADGGWRPAFACKPVR